MIGLASKQSKTKQTKERMGAASNCCPACSSNDVFIDHSRGEITCSTCGVVLSDHSIDMGPEWRAFTADEQNARQRVGDTDFVNGRYAPKYTLRINATSRLQ